MFPTLNYSGLYDVMNKMLPVVHLVTIGQEGMLYCQVSDALV